MRDPRAAAPPIPWEAPGRGVLWRLAATLSSAFTPSAFAPAMARPAVGPAAVFAVLVALPLAILEGVVPYTHTLRFEPVLAITLIGEPSTNDIWVDVLRAIGISLVLDVSLALALAVPYWSLSRAYGTPGVGGPAALRVILYRIWLLPAANLAFYVAIWLLPIGEGPLLFLRFATLGFLFLLWVSMRVSARLASGTSLLLSFVVAAVPFVLFFVVGNILAGALEPWIPHVVSPPG